MDKATASEFIERIEKHRQEEEALWRELRSHDDYEMHEDKVVESIINQRQKARELLADAEADLGSFDWIEDEEGDLVNRVDA